MDNNNTKILIDSTEFQKHILDYIGSDNFTKMINSTIFAGKQDCIDAIIHGMCIASMLTSQCNQFYITET